MKSALNFKRVVYIHNEKKGLFSDSGFKNNFAMSEGTVLTVHPYPMYVDEKDFQEKMESLEKHFPVYGIEASNTGDIIGDFYEDTFEDTPNGKNGSFNPGELEGLEGPYYVTGGLVSECVPNALETLLRSGEEAFLVEDVSYEKFGDEFMTYGEMVESTQDYSDIFRNLYMLGADTVELDDLV